MQDWRHVETGSLLCTDGSVAVNDTDATRASIAAESLPGGRSSR